MDKTNVLVLGGGDSPEREVSLRSANAVASAAKAAGFSVSEQDPAGDLAFLDSLPKRTIVLPILHGAGGEDGMVQAELEKREIAFLGADSQSSKACFDKWQTRKTIAAAGIPVAQGELVTEGTYRLSELSRRPHVLKVNRGGSSIGTMIARQADKTDQASVDKIFELDEKAVLEELIEGTEVTVPILDMAALPVIEIVPPPGGEFDYENKYNGASQEICPPASVSHDLQKKAQTLAEKVHAAMGCRHLSRVDLMIDAAGNLIVLEINTIPGLTDQSLYPKAAKLAGLDMPGLVARFVDLIKRDYRLK